MGEDTADRVIRGLVVGLMNGLLYFAEHRRVREAAETVAAALDPYFNEHPHFLLGLREGLLVFEGKPLYDLSVYAHRLISALEGCQAGGIRFERGVTVDEVHHLIKALMRSGARQAGDVNEQLRSQEVLRVIIEGPSREGLPETAQRHGGGGVPALPSWITDASLCRSIYTGALSALQDVMVELRQQDNVSLEKANDMAETEAVHRVFGAHAQSLMMSSTKSMHGHALGAASALELVATALAIYKGLVPPTVNFTKPGEGCDLDYVPHTARKHTINAALSNAFAFGGLNAVIALKGCVS